MSAIDTPYRSRDGLPLFSRDYPNPDPEAVVLCLPGLTANSADFEALALHLQPRCRVITPDLRGRGRSAFDPDAPGMVTTHDLMDMFHLLDLLDVRKVVIVATSLSGHTAIGMAALSTETPLGEPTESFRAVLPPHAGVVQALILNDIGPEIGPGSFANGAEWRRLTGSPVSSWDEAAAQQRTLSKGIPADHDDEDWMRVARRRYREDERGVPALAYDPGILPPAPPPGTAGPAAPPSLWPMFDVVGEIPTLVLRGELSTTLSPECLVEMQRRHPRLRSATIPGRGHCPTLEEPASLEAIGAFLDELAAGPAGPSLA